ncbi:hypothetical protein F5Y16DRAFT_199223 [Xylariaceae sp. FL0255]|nr:hypothetical protein F5Y16DRAFT_199223 [Xylariaceae sp. FL0255]
MLGPRVTAPAAKLTRSIATTATQPSTLITSSKNAAPLSRKYADLLKERNLDHDQPRHLYTRSSNLPHPPQRKMRLMQTFSSTATDSSSVQTMDGVVFPGAAAFEDASSDPYSQLRVPLLPDAFMTQHAPETIDGPVSGPQITVVAANPDLVSPAALTEVEGMGVDGVELNFIHEAAPAEKEQGMLTNIWKGLVDDVLGGTQQGAKLAL